MDPRGFFEKLLKGFKGDTRFALKALLIGDVKEKKKHWQGPRFAKVAPTRAQVKRKRLRKIQQESRRRNRAA